MVSTAIKRQKRGVRHIEWYGLQMEWGELETIDDASKGMTQLEMQAQYLDLLARLERAAGSGETAANITIGTGTGSFGVGSGSGSLTIGN